MNRFQLGIFFLLQVFWLTAQNGSPNISELSRTSLMIPEDTVQRPALIYEYFTLNDIEKRYTYTDTLYEFGFQNYDPIRAENRIYANLGNNGSASHDFLYKKKIYQAIDHGHHQFDPYKYQWKDLKIYTVNRAVSNLFFSNQSARQNFIVGADFARPFSDGTQVSIEYKRISQDGIYTDQNIKHTNLGLSFWNKSSSGKYQFIASLLNNVESSSNNGGVEDVEDLLNNNLRLRLNVPINLSNANSRYQERALHFSQYLNLAGSKRGFNLRAHHHLEAGAGYFQFYDDDINSILDSTFYTTFAVDSRGLRNDMEFTRFANSFSLQGIKDNGLQLEAGLSIELNTFDDHPSEEKINDLFLTMKGKIPYRGQLLDTRGWIGFGDANGTFDLFGSLDLNIKDYLDISASLETYRHRPSRVSNRLWVSEVLVWDNDFDKTFGTILSGDFFIPALRVKGKIQQTVETNAIYYGTDQFAKQFDEVYSASVLSAEHSFKFGPFGLENYAAIQGFSQNIYHLPTWLSRHNLYWEGFMFKRNLFSRLGIETTLVPTHEANAFSPLIGQFYQSETNTEFYPNTDVYFLAKVSDFRAFFKFENVTDFFVKDTPFYVVDHPQNDARFRFGIRWILKD